MNIEFPILMIEETSLTNAQITVVVVPVPQAEAAPLERQDEYLLHTVPTFQMPTFGLRALEVEEPLPAWAQREPKRAKITTFLRQTIVLGLVEGEHYPMALALDDSGASHGPVAFHFLITLVSKRHLV